MLTLRQKKFSEKKKQNLNFAWEHPEKREMYGPYSVNGVIKKGSSHTPKYIIDFISESDEGKYKRVHKSDKYLLYPIIRYKDHDDVYKEGYPYRPRSFGSTLKTSYKDSYRGFLKNEESLNNYRGNHPKRFYNDGSPGPTNEDIKNEIRKLAKKEAIKKWGGIGLAGAATIGTGAYLIHRHNKKKKTEKENKNDNTTTK